MNYKTIAEQIPEDYRREILLTNMIPRAQANRGDASMNYLFIVWKNYVEMDNPSLSFECGLCLERILNGWLQLQPVMIEIEKENDLYNTL